MRSCLMGNSAHFSNHKIRTSISHLAKAAVILFASLWFVVLTQAAAFAAQSAACMSVNSSICASGNTINPPPGIDIDEEYLVPGFAVGERIIFSAFSNRTSAGQIGTNIGTPEEIFPNGDGDNPAGNFSISGSGQFTAGGPSFQTLRMPYYVYNNAGTLTITLSCVQAPPTISSISPNQGPAAGGTTLTITGTGFTGYTSVVIGGTAHTPTASSDTSITVQTLPHAAGAVNVAVATPGGTVTAVNAFTYRAPPVVSGVSPNSGTTAGGTSVTISGSGFLNATGVTFDGISGTSLSAASDNSLTVVTPAHAAGPVNVVVTAPGGTGTGTNAFNYVIPPPSVSSTTPNNGVTAGGTVVTINGTNLLNASAVTFGGVPATGVNVLSATQLTAVTPTHAPGAVAVAVTTPGGSGSLSGAFTYIAPLPTVSGVSPNTGGTAGGTTIAVTGTGFTGATAVTLGGSAATGVTVISDTQLTAVTPSHAAGIVNVAVTTAGGTGSTASAFTYIAPLPAVSGISPSTGSTAGGATVTIAGSGFTAATAVTFGGTAATGVIVVSDTQITATTPIHIAGAVGVSVTTAGGTGSLASAYTYVAPIPSLSSVSPNTGGTAGGTTVTINGSGFIGATSVTFGGLAATGVNVVSNTQITAQTPSRAAGPVNVEVTTAGGIGGLTSAFTYVAPVPTVTNVTPNNGTTAGGTNITITGTGFTAATAVTIGGTAATGVVVVSDTSITAVTPSHIAGSVSVAVTTAGGTGSLSSAFTYLAPVPSVSGVSPNTGGTAGGASVTISGSGFIGATAVTFGGSAATGVTVISDTQITVVTPSHIAGSVAVAVTTAGGTGSLASAYDYVAGIPAISSLTPNTGPTAGGTTVTINGSGFIGTTSVTLDGIAATGVNVLSDTQITAVTPSHIQGIVDVEVTTAGGTGSIASAFSYVAPVPSISGASPNTGPTAGGTTVTINGSGFIGATAVTIGGIAPTGINVLSDTQITVQTTPRAAGPVNIAVTTAGGTGVLTSAFTYVAPVPAVTNVTPNNGTTAGGTNITITGTGFTAATAVTIGGTAATGVVVVSDTSITAVTPSHIAGSVSVAVTTAGGTGSLSSAFSYVAPVPSVSGVSPNTGGTAGGASVTISGSGFIGTTSVTFGGAVATGVTVISDTQITVVTPSHVAGSVAVAVTTAGGTGSLASAYNYVAGMPVVSSVTSSTGLTAGGTTVTINGSGFIGATSVTFGGTAATSVNVLSDTQMTAVTPPHAQGSVAVAVTTAGGTGTLTSGFNYLAPIPSVSSVSPSSGTTAGGTNVTINGIGFTAATSVTFSGTPAASYVVLSDTQVSAVSPVRGPGSVNVGVGTAGGTGILLTAYTFVAPVPTISGVSPNTGTTLGGKSVTITGTGFTGASVVNFGGIAASGLTVVSDTQITAMTPAHAAGAVDVSVTSLGGTVTAVSAYTYAVFPPTVATVSPNTGTTLGGTAVTITGTNLTGASSVTFGGAAATGVTVVSDTEITVTTPLHTPGVVDIVVTTPEGSGTGFGLFSYVTPVPSVTSASPSNGSTLGGALVTISGSGLTDTSLVTFGGTAATGITVISDTQITAVTPVHAAGIVDIVVTTPGGTGTGTSLYAYEVPAPTISSVSPTSGTTAGGQTITIAGTNLTGTSVVSFGGVAATNVVVVSDSQITAVTPAHAAGAVDVAVTTPGGTVIAVGGFIYTISPPVISSAAPNNGSTAGGTTVTITGSDLAGTTSVTFGGTSASSYTVISDTQLTAVTPAHAAGVADISVTTPSGTGILAAGFNFETPAPTVSGISPSSGPTDGGTAVTITGTSFNGATSVTFGGVAAGSFAIVSNTQITATTPAHSAGAANVVVTTPAGSGTSSSAVFTFIVPIRPDPSLDAEVIGLINAQTSAANRFARTQMRNFHGRLERLHNERERRSSSMNVRVGLPMERDNRTSAQRLLDARSQADASRFARTDADRDAATYGYGTDEGGPVSAAAGARVEDIADEAENSRLAFWSGGFVNFGDREDAGVDMDHMTVGVSGGFDYRFSDSFVAGLGIGYSRDRTDIGSNGTESKAQAFSAAVYSSFEPFENFFLDGLIGGGTLNFDSRRFVTANDEFATGDRSGTQAFGSLTAAYEVREEDWLISPYGRLEFSRSWLDGFSEQGGGMYGLTYGNQSIDTFSGVLGLRANMSFEMDWGVLKPGLRAEYVHDFEGSSKIRLGYTDLATLPYEIDVLAKERDYATLGLSLEFQFENEWDLLFDYRTIFDGEGDTDHTVGVQLSVRF